VLETDTDLFTLADAAGILGKKTDTLKKWFASGCPHRKTGNVYEVRIRDVFDWRIAYERQLCAPDDEQPDGTKLLDLEQEKAKLARAQTTAAEIAIAVKLRELVPAAEVEQAWAGMVAACKVKLRSIGSKIAARVAVPNPRVVAAFIDSEIDGALFELSANGHRDTNSPDVEEV
jgi:phage terminase Nu1 subunit (DNA packaging protein)